MNNKRKSNPIIASTKKIKSSSDDIQKNKSSTSTTTTTINNSFITQLLSKANESQSSIMCTICHNVSKYPVYASCQSHMYCFHCMFTLITSSSDYQIDFTTGQLKSVNIPCPQCKFKTNKSIANMLSNFVPTLAFNNTLYLTNLILNSTLNINAVTVKKEPDVNAYLDSFINTTTTTSSNNTITTTTTTDDIKIVEKCSFCYTDLENIDLIDEKMLEQRLNSGFYCLERIQSCSIKQKHLLICAQEHLPCVNHKNGCTLWNLYSGWDRAKNKYNTHTQICHHFHCIPCDTQYCSYEDMVLHNLLNTSPKIYTNTLNTKFTGPEHRLHKVVAELFQYKRFHHTTHGLIEVLQDVLNKVIETAKEDSRAKRSSIELYYLQDIQKIIQDRITILTPHSPELSLPIFPPILIDMDDIDLEDEESSE